MKKIISVLLTCLIIIISVVNITSFAEDYEGEVHIILSPEIKESIDPGVWVGGVKVTDENKEDVLSDGGSVRFNDETDTLILTDATIINEKGHGIYAYGINLTVEGVDTDAKGNNSITGKSTVENGIDEEGYEFTQTNPGCGIFVEGDGYEGNGALTITGSFGKISGEEGHGITAYRNIDISALIDEISCTGGIESAINSSFGCVIIKDSAEIKEIISKEYDGIEASKDIIISGNVGKIIGGGYAGIHSSSGDVFVSGNVESIVGYISGIEAYKVIEWDMDDNELYIGGSVKIGGTVGEISGGTLGIYTEANLNMSGSAKILATDTEGEEIRAISVGGEIIISDTPNFIKEPKEYKIGTVVAQKFEDETGIVKVEHNTILESDEKPATTIEFSGFVNPFEDVKKSDWYYEDIRYAVENGLFTGVTEKTFEPESNLTRAMLVTILWRLEKNPVVNYLMSFEDVEAQMWYTEALRWAASEKLVNGISETEFAPNEKISREQLATIMFRYATKKGVAPEGAWAIRLDYTDLASISDYAQEAVMYCRLKGIMQGKENNNFAPKDNATRAETAVILHRFINDKN